MSIETGPVDFDALAAGIMDAYERDDADAADALVDAAYTACGDNVDDALALAEMLCDLGALELAYPLVEHLYKTLAPQKTMLSAPEAGRIRSYRALLLWAELLSAEEAFTAACELCQKAARLLPDAFDALLLEGEVRFDAGEAASALALAQRARALEPHAAAAHRLVGHAATLLGEGALGEGALAEAERLDPEAFPRPPHVDVAHVQRIVDETLAALPEAVRGVLQSYAVTILANPLAAGFGESLGAGTLGLHEGVPPMLRSTEALLPTAPNRILLFHQNLEFAAQDVAHLDEVIETTLLHEIGHALGLDEDDLVERGLD